MSKLVIDDTSTVSVIGADPEQVVSVTVGDLETLLDDGMDVEAGFIGVDTVTVHERTCHIAPDDLASEQCMGPMLSCDRCCSAFPPINDDYNYCPNCGARVVGE